MEQISVKLVLSVLDKSYNRTKKSTNTPRTIASNWIGFLNIIMFLISKLEFRKCLLYYYNNCSRDFRLYYIVDYYFCHEY